MSIYAAQGLLFHLQEPDEHETKENFSSKSNYLLCIPIRIIILQGILRSCRSRIECLKAHVCGVAMQKLRGDNTE